MFKRIVLTSIIAACLLCGLAADVLQKGSSELNEIYQEINGTPEMIYVYIVMKESYDTDELYSRVVDLNKTERREYTINTLQDFSKRTQANLRKELELLEAKNLVDRVTYLWITNVIGMKTTAEALSVIHNHPDIESIQYDPMVNMLYDYEVVDVSDGMLSPDFEEHGDGLLNRRRKDEERVAPEHQTRATYNVRKVNAPQVWEQGYTGEGVLVAVLDTGVNYNHLDLRSRMWIHPDFPNHGYNFVENNLETMDLRRHGTHCAGTVAGTGAAGSRIGVAPGAQIMALKTLSDEGSGNVQHSLAAFQFAVQHGAHILSCSFGAMGAPPDGRRIRRNALNNVLNAGVIASVSAGNEGNNQGEHPIPRNIGSPSDCPPPWLHPDQTLLGGISAVVSVGATDSDDRIANFSARGPTTWSDVGPYNDYAYSPGIGLIRPDITAPGVNVRSARHDNNTGYTTLSGTSMAAPAVSGIFALMLSKDPDLTPERMAKILELTSHPLSQSKSNVFGSGRADALAAMAEIKYIEIENFSVTSEHDIPRNGETVTINITLRNRKQQTAFDVFGRLSIDDEYVTIVNERAEFGNIGGGQTTTLNNAFTIVLADNIPHDRQLDFTLHISPFNDDYSWNDNFSFNVDAPYVRALTPIIYDPAPGGNNNGVIEPGEDVTLFVPIANIGGAPTLPVSMQIHSVNNQVTINEISDSYFSYIKEGEKMFPAINISVANTVPVGTILPFNYSFQTGNYNFSGRFSSIVGESISVQLGQGAAVTEDSSPSPISIYFRSLRSQTVYTAQELNQAGASGTIPLTRFGFFVHTAPMHQLPNFVIRMKHTRATNASEHIDGPYTTVFGPTNYRPTAGGWDVLELNTPFVWNGVDNILVDTAFSVTSGWDASGQVRIYNVENGFRYVRNDSGDQTNVRTSDVNNNKPQAKLHFELAEGIDPLAPTNLTAGLVDEAVRIEWDAPNHRDGHQQSKRRNPPAELRQETFSRNPDSYNVYRNGVKINSSPIINTFFIDNDIQPSASYFYYATSVYSGVESRGSVITAVRGISPPQFNPPSGIRSNPFLLTITSLTPDTEIYYTLDGEAPSHNTNLYEEPIEISADTQVKAIAYKEGYLNSVVAEAEYIFLSQPNNLRVNPSINFALISWEYPERASSEGRDTRNNQNRDRTSNYTDDKTRSLLGYNLYRAFNSDNFTMINEFLIIDREFFDFDMEAGRYQYAVSAVYDIGESEMTKPVVAYIGIVATPTFTPAPGEYDSPVEVRIECLTEGAVIRYTVNNTNPNISSPLYTGEPIQVEDNMVIKAMGFLAGWQNSSIGTAEYIITTTGIEEEELTPAVTELHSAYPNPFNPATTIRFSLREDDKVKLEIYNIAGQLVNRLIDEPLSAGMHTVKWQGTDERGNPVSSGIYFYRLSSSNYQKVRKAVLLK